MPLRWSKPRVETYPVTVRVHPPDGEGEAIDLTPYIMDVPDLVEVPELGMADVPVMLGMKYVSQTFDITAADDEFWQSLTLKEMKGHLVVYPLERSRYERFKWWAGKLAGAIILGGLAWVYGKLEA